MLYPRQAVERKLKGNRVLAEEIWKALSQISPEDLMGSGRVYGGGLYKLEPSELGNVPADAVERLLESC
jgi:hypothetical protein